MKILFKITTIVLFGVIIIISSCKKEEEATLINGCTYPSAINYNSSANTDDGSCIMELLGCTDSTAINYNISANTDDGSCVSGIQGCTDMNAMNFNILATLDDESCIYAYNIAQGIWNITPDCEEYTIPVIGTTISLNEQLPETIDVQGAGGNLLYIEIGETLVNGTIDNAGNITVPNQTISLDMGFGQMDINIQGDGLITTSISGNMNLIYSFDVEVIAGFPISESLDCSILLNR